MKKKVFTLLLCFTTLLSLFTGCGEEAVTTGTSSGDNTSGEVTTEEVTTEKSTEKTRYVLMDNLQEQYCIVYDHNSDDAKAGAMTISEKFNTLTGKAMNYYRDTSMSIPTNLHKIYVGETLDFPYTEVKTKLTYGTSISGFCQEDIYILTLGDSQYNVECSSLCRRFKKEDDQIVIYEFERSYKYNSQLASIPTVDSDKDVHVYDCGCGQELCLDGGTVEDMNAYGKKLIGLGCEKIYDYTIGETSYQTYTNDDYAFYLNVYNGSMRVVVCSKDTAFLPSTEKSSFTKVCDTTGYLVGITPNTYENGMCMIYLLADGTFLLFDGGCCDDDAHHLYDLLTDIAKENHLNEIVISTWIMTHCHSDHVNFFPAFTENYASKVTVKQFLIPETSSEMGSAGGSNSLEEKTINLAGQYKGAKVSSLHAGQSFWLADVHLEVLYTAEQLPVNGFTDYNAASSVIRMTVNGKRILMTGDTDSIAWPVIVSALGSELKSDYLQVPHHGAHLGGTTAAYDQIKPDYLLWPCGDTLYNNDLTSWNANYKVNLYLLNTIMAGKTNYNFVAGAYNRSNGTYRITKFIPGQTPTVTQGNNGRVK